MEHAGHREHIGLMKRMADSRQRVLVVEDSATMRGFVTATLESGGPFAVTQAESGFHALKGVPDEWRVFAVAN